MQLDLLIDKKDHAMKQTAAGPEPAKLYDVLVLGAGPAGLNAALYASRKGLEVLIIGEKVGGQLVDTSTVDNYLGSEMIGGYDLAQLFHKHVESLGIPLLEWVKVQGYQRVGQRHELTLEDGSVLQGKKLILATGSAPRHLEVAGEERLSGRGVSYCAICDGPLYRGKHVIVAGGGNSAFEAVQDLAKVAAKVSLVHRSEYRADKVIQDQVDQLSNVELFKQTQILEVMGDEYFTAVRVLDKSSQTERLIKADGLFVEIGHIPTLGPFSGLLATNENGEVQIDPQNRSSLEGVYAAGDVTGTEYKQIIIAAAEGAKAALSLNHDLNLQA